MGCPWRLLYSVLRQWRGRKKNSLDFILYISRCTHTRKREPWVGLKEEEKQFINPRGFWLKPQRCRQAAIFSPPHLADWANKIFHERKIHGSRGFCTDIRSLNRLGVVQTQGTPECSKLHLIKAVIIGRLKSIWESRLLRQCYLTNLWISNASISVLRRSVRIIV